MKKMNTIYTKGGDLNQVTTKSYYLSKIFAGCMLLLSMLTACSEWLDVQPVTEVPEGTMYENEQGFFEVLSGTYVQMGSPQLYGGELTLGLLDALAQRYTVSSSRLHYPRIIGTPTGVYDYQSLESRTAFIDPVWEGLYRIIGNTNNLLENIDKRQSVFRDNHYNIAKGQALGLRAFLHFDLLRLFAPNPQQAGQDTFIPYVKKYNPISSALLTVKSTLDSCLQDLNEAQRLLAVDKNMLEISSDRYLTFTRNKFNYYTVLGLKARIYLYSGQLDSAYRYAHMVVDAAPAKFKFATKERVLNGDRTFVTEHLFSLQIQNLRNNYNSLFVGPEKLAVTQSALNKIYENKTADFRFIDHWRSVGSDIHFLKFSQDGISGTDSTSFAAQVPLLRLSEMYYIAAESSPRIDSATYFLNQIRVNRGISGTVNELRGLNKEQLAQEIQKEYIKEFYGEGQLFYFYKRLGRLSISRLDEDEGTMPTPASFYTWPMPLSEFQGR